MLRSALPVRVRVSEGPERRSGGGVREGVTAQHVDVFRDQRGEALYVFIGNTGATVAELGERGVQVPGVSTG
jgi:hypothetical protein